MKKDLTGIVDTIPALIWRASSDGEIDYLNHRWVEYTGVEEEVRGRIWQFAIHPEDVLEMSGQWKSMVATGRPLEMEARLRRFDGEYRWFVFRVSPVSDASGQIFKWCGVGTDIHDRKHSEEALRAREKNLLSIADSIPALIAFMTPDGKVENANRHVQEYFGAGIEELKGWATTATVHPEDLPAVTAAWKKAMETEEPYDSEHRKRRADGVYRWFHVRALPLKDAEGRIARWYCLQTDIDDRKRVEALLVGEKRLLEMVAGGHSMSVILDALCELVESTASGCYCGVVLVDPSGTRLEYGAAPSLPASFINSIIGRSVNVEMGPSAMAAYLNEQVIAADLRTETRWTSSGWCSMALAHGVKACWSSPFSSTSGNVLGAFAIYYDNPTAPTAQHQALIGRLTNIASIAVERSQSHAALIRSEARKTAILDSALDCIVTIDHEGRITEFNPAAEKTFGYRRDEVVDELLSDIIIPSTLREKHLRGFARFLATGEAHVIGKRIEMTAVRADGREFPVELAITRIPMDGPPSFTGYLRDITERKQAEEKLRRSDAYLAEAQKLSMTGSFGWNVSADEHVWSEQTFRIFEYDVSTRITLERILERVHPLDVPLMRRALAMAADGRDLDYECRLSMPNGFVKHLHIIGHGTRMQDGRLEYIGAVQDVTERRLSEEALGKVRSELAHVARVTSLGVLTASIAHEVNQPLSGIITNAGTCLRMLAGDRPNIEGARETARRTIRDGNRASNVINRLRALFDKKDATREIVDLNEATREVIALSLSELQSSKVILRPELDDDLPPVKGDRVQLQQVMLNLLLNASDAMSGVDDRPRQLVIRTERDEGDRVRLTVQDSGVGIEPQSVDKLFDAFYTTKSGGMGIGLSISRSIIESHQGRLWAAPNDGPGATFSFSIPREPESVNRALNFGAGSQL